jgi:hypothetical protein
MCRSIKTLRPPFTDAVTEADIRAAALQYVRKVSGFRTPAAHNAEAFDAAVSAVAEASANLLAQLEIRGSSVASGGAPRAAAGAFGVAVSGTQRSSSTRTREPARASRGSAVSRGASRASASAT